MENRTEDPAERRSSRVWRRIRGGITITVAGLAAVAGVQLGLTAPPVSPVDPATAGASAGAGEGAAVVPPATVPVTPDQADQTDEADQRAPANRDNDGDAGNRGQGRLVGDNAPGRDGGRR